MKPYKLLIAIAVTSIVIFTNCTKEPPIAKVYPIEGIYTGTYTGDKAPNIPPREYGFAIYPDGMIQTKGALLNGVEGFASGTWTLNGTKFKAVITTYPNKLNNFSAKQIITATYVGDGTLKDGVWQDDPKSEGTGKFSTMTRVK